MATSEDGQGGTHSSPLLNKSTLINHTTSVPHHLPCHNQHHHHQQHGRPAPRPLRRSSTDGNVEKGRTASSSVTIVHFNDVYNIEGREKEPVGGAARFKSAVDKLQHLQPLVLFSGDALAPSTISVVMKGEQMVPVLQNLGIHCAVYGNHDFDYGVDHLVELAGRMNFPWLMSNVYWKKSGRLLANGLKKHVLTWQGRKIGLMGLVEKEWIVTLATVEISDIVYVDFVETARQLVQELQEEGCELLIALTHMRVPNDLKLAREVPELHMILGGHDHHYEQQQVGKVLVLKSGSEFREFSQVTITFPDQPLPQRQPCSSRGHTSTDHTSRRPTISVARHEVTGSLTPDPVVDAIVRQYLDKVTDGLQQVLGEIDVSLEGRFRHVRTKETNLGNLVADIMKRKMRTDVALLNSGTLRSDVVHEPGPFKMKDLLEIFPMMDSLVKLKLTGLQLYQALENGVSQYPRHEGRFPQVSGVQFVFDPSQPSGSRVLMDRVIVGEEPLQEERMYTLTTRGYIGQRGKDGYDVFKKCEVLVAEDEGPLLSTIVREYIEHFYPASSSDRTDGAVAVARPIIRPRVERRISSDPLSESSGSE